MITSHSTDSLASVYEGGEYGFGMSVWVMISCGGMRSIGSWDHEVQEDDGEGCEEKDEPATKNVILSAERDPGGSV